MQVSSISDVTIQKKTLVPNTNPRWLSPTVHFRAKGSKASDLLVWHYVFFCLVNVFRVDLGRLFPDATLCLGLEAGAVYAKNIEVLELCYIAGAHRRGANSKAWV